MKIGLIDLGSNTIKLEIFETNGQNFKSVFYAATYAYIIDDICAGLLTQAGVDKIIQILRQYRLAAQELGCDKLLCFSTASLRQIDNQKAIVDSVYSSCGVSITPITGEEEAYYNFLSLKRVAGDAFLGGDMGGGSMQLFSVRQGVLQKESSLPLGALKLYQQFVSRAFPSLEEARQIGEYVQEEIASAGFSKEEFSDSLYFMGGSMRTISALLPSGKTVFSPEELNELLESFLKDLPRAKQKIESVCPERLKTILPAMAALLSVCEFFHVKQVRYTQSSVREGYLIDQLNRKECIER